MKKLRLYLILIYLRDNWPTTGDYDMNDLVIGIRINNTKRSGARRSLLKIIYTLYSHRRYKNKLGLVSNWMSIPASAVSGMKAGQTDTVIQLFSDAHSLY